MGACDEAFGVSLGEMAPSASIIAPLLRHLEGQLQGFIANIRRLEAVIEEEAAVWLFAGLVVCLFGG